MINYTLELTGGVAVRWGELLCASQTAVARKEKMYNIVQEKIIKQIKSIIKEAKDKKLWLFSEYLNLCISPEEIEEEIKNGFCIVDDWILKKTNTAHLHERSERPVE